MTTEEFLRNHFGLKGDFYSKDFTDEQIDYDPELQFTPDAWELWGKALRMLEALEKEGYIGEGKKGDFYQFFWDNLPD